MLDWIKNNPALLIGLFEALLALAVTFGVDLTIEQTSAVLAALVALGSLATRQSVNGPVTVERLKREHEDEVVDAASHRDGHA